MVQISLSVQEEFSLKTLLLYLITKCVLKPKACFLRSAHSAEEGGLSQDCIDSLTVFLSFKRVKELLERLSFSYKYVKRLRFAYRIIHAARVQASSLAAFFYFGERVTFLHYNNPLKYFFRCVFFRYYIFFTISTLILTLTQELLGFTRSCRSS